ncbi:MAG: OmpA family protein [Bacteroidales bacterium]|nr:OmpA family protein [Bacteroidales bacterium]
MIMKKTILSLAISMVVSLSAFAQTTYVEGNTTYEFEPYNYLQIQGGLSHTVGEAKFSKLLSPAAALSFGRQFSPIWGGRLGLSGWESKGAWSNPALTYKFNYVALNVDAILNLTNLFSDWKPYRKVNVGIFLGIAGNLGFNNDGAKEVNDKVAGLYGTKENFGHLWTGSKLFPVGRGGVMVDFRCNERWSINLEANANVTNDHYNSKCASNADWYFNGLVGVSYKFRDGYKKTVRQEPQPEPEPEALCGHCGKTLSTCQYRGNHPKCETCGKFLDECQYAGKHPAPKAEPLICNVFFQKNKWDISEVEAAKVQQIADYLNKYPNAKVALVGYADVKTGNAKINSKLSEKRSAEVAKYLQEKYNISANRITTDYKGDTVQPFAVNEENRVCICIAEDK